MEMVLEKLDDHPFYRNPESNEDKRAMNKIGKFINKFKV